MIIADIGINHNGDLDTALTLIRKCKEIGVDVVKFQKRNPDVCVPTDQKNIVKSTRFGEMKYIDYKHKMEFGQDEYDVIDAYCKYLNISWTASVWDVDSLEFMMQYDVPFLKIPSALLNNVILLNKIKEIDNRTFLFSSGMATYADIDIVYNLFKDKWNVMGLLYCVSNYPTKLKESNLNCIKEMEIRYPKWTIGYSGHEEGYFQSIIARVLGCRIIERHITLNTSDVGSDHSSSLDVGQFKEMINQLNNAYISLGNKNKTINSEELEISKKLKY